MNRSLILLVIAVSLSAGPGAMASHSIQGDYTTGDLGPGVGFAVACYASCNGLGPTLQSYGIRIGGSLFPADDEVPTFVSIDDRSDGNVAFYVVQDLDDDGLFESSVEPSMGACGMSAPLISETVPFVAGHVVAVGVQGSNHLFCPGAIALGGTITLTYGGGG